MAELRKYICGNCAFTTIVPARAEAHKLKCKEVLHVPIREEDVRQFGGYSHTDFYNDNNVPTVGNHEKRDL